MIRIAKYKRVSKNEGLYRLMFGKFDTYTYYHIQEYNEITKEWENIKVVNL